MKDMREIKFRAWNSRTKVMQYTNDDQTVWAGGTAPSVNTTIATSIGAQISGDFVAMQYTSLKDKNGKEIYEGDIIVWNVEYDADYDGDMPIVKRSKGKHAIRDIFDQSDILFANQEGDGVEVIGNIWEHPELLNL